jgi:hypothetical protein
MDFPVLGELIGFVGLNLDYLAEKLPPEDQSVYLTNGENILVRNGRIEKLKGTDYLNSITSQQGISGYRVITGLGIYRKYSTGIKYLMAATPRNLYYLKDDDEWYNLGTIPAGDIDSILTYANVEDKFVLIQADDGTVWSWDGTTFVELFSSPQHDNLKARFLLKYKTHLMLLRTIETGTENYQRIWFSDPGDIYTYSDNYKLDIDTEGVIQGGMVMEDQVIVYLDDSIYRVEIVDYGTTASNYGVASTIIAEGGLIAPKSLTGNKKDTHYFLSKEGLMKLVKGDVPRSISKQKFNSLILDEIDPAYYFRAAARFYPHLHQLFLCYPKSGSSYNDTQIIVDTETEELISKKTLAQDNYSAYGEYEKDLSGLPVDERKNYGLSIIPIFGTADGYIKEQKIIVYEDGISPYESNAVFAPTFWKDKSQKKRILQADLLIEKLTDEDIAFSIELANEMNENFAYSYSVTGSGNQGVRRYECKSIDCLGKEFKAKIKDVSNPYGWKLHGIIFRGYYTAQK